MSVLLEVRNLNVNFKTEDGIVKATRNLNFELNSGEILAIVGESGCGKSVSSMAIMGLHNQKNVEITGEINLYTGNQKFDLLKATEKEFLSIRGKSISMIFQDPMSAFNPFYTIGDQISEAWLVHNDGTKLQAINKAKEILNLVGIPDVENRVSNYPHQFSGGMRQRALIAMALINQPRILIADEPTTALDVTVQLQILNLLSKLQKELNMSIILITHDMGIVAEIANRINVMYAGTIVETGRVEDVLVHPNHPYSIGLLNSIPRLNDSSQSRLQTIPGQPPSLLNLPLGCSFEPRCIYSNLVKDQLCKKMEPELHRNENSYLRCHLESSQIYTGFNQS